MHVGVTPPTCPDRLSTLVRVLTRVTPLVLAVSLLVSPAAASVEAAGTSRLPVLGFQSDGSTPALIAADAPGLAAVGVDGVNLTGPGSVSTPAVADRAQLAAAHRAGLTAMLLVGNWSDTIEDFSEPLAWRTLGHQAMIARAAATLAADVNTEGWNGVSVDLESLAPRDRAGLTAFVDALRADLPEAASLTVCVTSFPSLADYGSNGYDLRGLAAAANQLVLMAYDEHGPWENTPGPVGAETWVQAGLHAVMRVVPGRQIDLGVAGYGYAWRPHANVMLSDAGARRLVRREGGRARWVSTVGEWTATLRDGSTVWWSDERTLALRERLAARLGLHGLAVWSLALSDPIR